MKLITFSPDGAQGCTVTAWIHDHEGIPNLTQLQNPGIVICPGGGYGYVSPREAEPVAAPYYAAGYNTFILYYSVCDQAKDFQPLTELAATFRHIRSHEEEFLTLPNKIAVTGFSAGGHMACSLGTLFNDETFLAHFGSGENIRPDAMILGYPVITAGEFAHVGTIANVSGAEEGSDAYRWFDLSTHVDAETPPTFLWHTAEDGTVPVENSLLMAMALSRHKVPFECHVFPTGKHGISVCTGEVNTYDPYNGRWVDMSIQWLNRVFDYHC